MLPKRFEDFDENDFIGMRDYLLDSPQNEIFSVSELQYLQSIKSDTKSSFLECLFNKIGKLSGKAWKNLLGEKSLHIKKPLNTTNDEG